MLEYGDSPLGRPMMIDNNPDQSRVHLVELGESNPNQYWRFRPAGDGLYTIGSGDRCMTAADSRKDVASVGCDGRAEQKWKLVPIADNDNGSEEGPGTTGCSSSAPPPVTTTSRSRAARRPGRLTF
ncbi:RICIN domain-containing protein [Streptomyces blastmyceticus]|uniref:Ricin B lectin domain-containing protein n=1 Tax=Streptomyces blastmyceticus TaxID=68180 RepID=A0ABP3GIW0_9ACTN